MKISAINSNYQTKKSLKKNQLNNNTNMSTPSFEGANKLNKVSAKKLALALMAGIAVTTPSVYAAPTKTVTESTIQNTGKKDFYINPDVAKKYPEINPAEHRSFDLYQDDLLWISDKQREITSYGKPLHYMQNSLDAQLLNYYVQNPQEKNLPNSEIIQGFIDNYNKNKKSYYDEATLEDAQDMLNLYKEIAQKHNVSEQEAVWNCPARDRDSYQNWLNWSVEASYKKNNYFMNPSSENRKKIQDYVISCDGNEYDSTQKRVVEDMNAYSPEVIDEIHKRGINTRVHKQMSYSSSKGSDYSMYIENYVEPVKVSTPTSSTQNNIGTKDTKNNVEQANISEPELSTQNNIESTKAITKTAVQNSAKNGFYIHSKVAEKYPEINPAEHKNFDLYKEDISWIGGKTREIIKYGKPLYYLQDSLDAQLLNYYVQNPQEKNLPNNEIIQGFVDNYNQTKKSYQDEATLEDAQDMLNVYKEIAQKHNVSEQEAVWNCPARDRDSYQTWLSLSENTYYKKNNYFMNPTPENRSTIQNYIISYDGNEIDDTEERVVEDMNVYSPEVIDEIHKRGINTSVHEKMTWPLNYKGSDYSEYIETEEANNVLNNNTYSSNVVTNSEATQTNTNKNYENVITTINTITNDVVNATTEFTNSLQYSNLLSQKSTTERQITATKTLINSYTDEIRSRKSRISSKENQIKNLEDRIKKYKNDIRKAEEDYNRHKKNGSSFTLLNSDRESISNNKKLINKNTNQINEYQSDIRTLKNDITTLESKLSNARMTLQQLEQSLQDIARKLNELQK